MTIDPSAVLALLSEQVQRIALLEQEVTALRAALEAQTPQSD